MKPTDYIVSDAVFSDDGKYRYSLTRRWAEGPCALWVGANPSKAGKRPDESDHTLDRIVHFTMSESLCDDSPLAGCQGILLGNAYGWISTDPVGLLIARDPVGPDNDSCLASMAAEAVAIVVCWGQIPDRRRAGEVVSLLQRSGKPLYCLGMSAKGAPSHPARLSNATRVVPWRRIA